MRIVVITSCTGEKTVESKHELTLADFQRGSAHVKILESGLRKLLTPAEKLYSGQHHVRLMRGVERVRASAPTSGIELDLKILSAGYGIVSGKRKLAPYEATFQGMSRSAIRDWANRLGIPGQFRRALKRPYDLALVLLGDAYLRACDVDTDTVFGGPTVIVCGAATAQELPRVKNLRVVATTEEDTRRFGAPFVSLKGEIGARMLERLASQPSFSIALRVPGTDVLTDLSAARGSNAEAQRDSRAAPRVEAQSNPKVDQVISISDDWKNLPHRRQLRYFIPEWKDLVDPDFDFANDEHSSGKAHWSNEVYAHQMFPNPNYDGILVSRSVVDPPKKKNAKLSPTARRIYELGVHRMLRVPDTFEIMGDCGAFGYVKCKDPLYSTEDVVDYYTRARFNYGVSVDHLVLPFLDPKEQRYRYHLTLKNAEAFIEGHGGTLPWTPIGAVQGWDPESYAEAAAALIGMGYRYIAIGAVAKRNDKYIKSVIRAVYPKVLAAPQRVDLHVLGVARASLVPFYLRHGVTSMDSASSLRQAWMGAKDNYHAPGRKYSAIRIRDSHGSQV